MSEPAYPNATAAKVDEKSRLQNERDSSGAVVDTLSIILNRLREMNTRVGQNTPLDEAPLEEVEPSNVLDSLTRNLVECQSIADRISAEIQKLERVI